MSVERAAVVTEDVQGKEVIYVLARVQSGTLFILHKPHSGFSVEKFIKQGDSISDAVFNLIPQILLGILLGRLDA